MPSEKEQEQEQQQDAQDKGAAKADPFVPVRALGTENGMTLVEWTDDAGQLRRNWLSADVKTRADAAGSVAFADRPNRGVPYGDDFGKLAEFQKDDARAFASELHRAGVWTYQDATQNPLAVRAALKSVEGVDLSAVLGAAEKLRKSAK